MSTTDETNNRRKRHCILSDSEVTDSILKVFVTKRWYFQFLSKLKVGILEEKDKGNEQQDINNGVKSQDCISELWLID